MLFDFKMIDNSMEQFKPATHYLTIPRTRHRIEHGEGRWEFEERKSDTQCVATSSAEQDIEPSALDAGFGERSVRCLVRSLTLVGGSRFVNTLCRI